MAGDRETSTTVFGNPVPARRRRSAARWRRRLARRYGFKDNESYPLTARPNAALGAYLGLQDIVRGVPGERLEDDRGILIGAICMGYGHYRIGMSVASAAQAVGLTPYWFDLLGFDSPAARLIRDIDRWYSIGSRLSQRWPWFNRLAWEPLMKTACRRAEKNYRFVEMGRLLSTVCRELPRSMPFVATHPWLAMAAVHAAHANVINMIPDNWPLGFHLAEGALHTVQGPSMHFAFRTMREMGTRGAEPRGVPARDVRPVGHYVDHELVVNIDSDCNARLDRVRHKLPRRVLVSMGGAGAQEEMVKAIVRRLVPIVSEGRAVLFINCGDHADFAERISRVEPRMTALAVQHTEWEKSVQFIQSALTGPVKGLHLFVHRNLFAAVYATNLLMRGSDLLITKPGELAYYPIPKLLLPRVGGHESAGAVRCAELGDGTAECADIDEVLRVLDLLLFEDDLLDLYCDNIVKLNRAGLYSGAYRVVELALERRSLKPGARD